jgi:hypothetical protein
MKYHSTLSIVRAYLGTLEPEAVAGIANNITQCPVARAMQWKYSELFVVTLHFCYLATDFPSGGDSNPPEIFELVRGIDLLNGLAREEKPITRREVEQILEALA